MDLGLRGRVAIVTGGSLGVGRAAATALLNEGAAVVIASQDDTLVDCAPMRHWRIESGRLTAASFFSIGENSISGVYAVFEPELTHRSLGIFTMLKEIEFAVNTGRQFYYQGYCYDGPSFYDYKKRFRGTEGYNWLGEWQPLAGLESE